MTSTRMPHSSSPKAATPRVIQARLGHASIKTTLDTYGHLFDGLDEADADRLDEMWRKDGVEFSRLVAT